MKTLNLRFGIGKTMLAATLFAGSLIAHADPVVMGLELGKATVDDAFKAFPAALKGTSMLGGPGITLEDGLPQNIRRVDFVFDENNKLVMAHVLPYRDRYHSVEQGLGQKYKPANYVFQKFEARGDKKYLAPVTPSNSPTATFVKVFQDGNTIIQADGLKRAVTYFTLDAHPALSGAAEKMRAERNKAATEGL